MFDVYRMDKVQNERGREKTSGLCEHHIVPRRISQCMLMMVCLLDECEAHPAQPSPHILTWRRLFVPISELRILAVTPMVIAHR